jgi:hypothetical protein
MDPANNEHRGHLLSGYEIDFLTKLSEFLQPLFYLTTKLSIEKFSPCSLVIPSIEKLDCFYREIEINDVHLEGKGILTTYYYCVFIMFIEKRITAKNRCWYQIAI